MEEFFLNPNILPNHNKNLAKSWCKKFKGDVSFFSEELEEQKAPSEENSDEDSLIIKNYK